MTLPLPLAFLPLLFFIPLLFFLLPSFSSPLGLTPLGFSEQKTSLYGNFLLRKPEEGEGDIKAWAWT